MSTGGADRFTYRDFFKRFDALAVERFIINPRYQ
jgi:hypothetical protein